MKINEYLERVNQDYQAGKATELTYRGYLQQLLESIVPTIKATNEPKRQSCGAPDYILTKKGVPIGFIEAKDIGDKDLEGAKKAVNKEQFDRYKASLNNIIFTDYLDFHLYRDGQFVMKIAIGEITDKGIKPLTENFSSFENFIKDFCTQIGQTIKSAKKLAEMMAGKARLLSEVIEKALTSDVTNQEDSTLKDQMKAFKLVLIHDITPKGFADVYAQTIAYGMFAARLHDATLPTFSRQEAAELIPKSNPFLRKLFGYIAGPDIDDRIKWIVDSLVDIFLYCNVEEILKNYGKSTKMEDPVIHFYETFLSAYDPKLRKDRGVWYTPQPVVNFIVRAVDQILKTEFDLPDGLADNSKTRIKIEQGGKRIEQDFHKVQILDPATGTGTFLAEVVKHIQALFDGKEGIWSNYVDSHLLPRLNGFELLMASYAMAHLKLDLLLTETGYKPTTNQRFRVYLTNSLEEHHQDTGTLFANWLSSEANEANHIKRDTPVMCIIGNPPYKGISSNNGKWISRLIEDYKYVDGVHFKERKHWLNNDYVKFIRYGQHFIEKNGSGVLAFINPNGFLDDPTFRGMRWHLLKTYDKIYTIDLHGDSKINKAPDGTADVNVFNIMQGVSINIFIKTGKKKDKVLGKVYHNEIYGKREVKFEYLNENSLSDISFRELKPEKPFMFFLPKNQKGMKEYENGFKVNELFSLSATGIVTARDRFAIDFDKNALKNRIDDFANQDYTDDDVRNKYFGKKKQGKYLAGDSRGWSLSYARKKIAPNSHLLFIKPVNYRPFDTRYVYYTPDIIDWGRVDVMQHLLVGDNIGIVLCRQIVSDDYCHIFVTNKIVDDSFVSNKSKERGYVYPLYSYGKNTVNQTNGQATERTPNINAEIVKQIAENLSLTFTNEKETTKDTFAPIDILDYVYAVLHSPMYRDEYKEFLKVDFPRVPYPKDKDTFWKLINLGSQIRQTHLLENLAGMSNIIHYPVDGDNMVTKIKYHDGKVYINDTQHFDNVALTVWEYKIGGYQPAQKWLKDRINRKLDYDDVVHYQRIISSIGETVRIISGIEKFEMTQTIL